MRVCYKDVKYRMLIVEYILMSIHIELDEEIDYYEVWDIPTTYCEQTVTVMMDLAHWN